MNWKCEQRFIGRTASKLHRGHIVLCIVPLSLDNHAQWCIFTLRGFFKWKMSLKGLNTMNEPKLIIVSREQGPLRIQLQRENLKKKKRRDKALAIWCRWDWGYYRRVNYLVWRENGHFVMYQSNWLTFEKWTLKNKL